MHASPLKGMPVRAGEYQPQADSRKRAAPLIDLDLHRANKRSKLSADDSEEITLEEYYTLALKTASLETAHQRWEHHTAGQAAAQQQPEAEEASREASKSGGASVYVEQGTQTQDVALEKNPDVLELISRAVAEAVSQKEKELQEEREATAKAGEECERLRKLGDDVVKHAETKYQEDMKVGQDARSQLEKEFRETEENLQQARNRIQSGEQEAQRDQATIAHWRQRAEAAEAKSQEEERKRAEAEAEVQRTQKDRQQLWQDAKEDVTRLCRENNALHEEVKQADTKVKEANARALEAVKLAEHFQAANRQLTPPQEHTMETGKQYWDWKKGTMAYYAARSDHEEPVKILVDKRDFQRSDRAPMITITEDLGIDRAKLQEHAQKIVLAHFPEMHVAAAEGILSKEDFASFKQRYEEWFELEKLPEEREDPNLWQRVRCSLIKNHQFRASVQYWADGYESKSQTCWPAMYLDSTAVDATNRYDGENAVPEESIYDGTAYMFTRAEKAKMAQFDTEKKLTISDESGDNGGQTQAPRARGGMDSMFGFSK